jgi:GTPase SAR1 family protein
LRNADGAFIVYDITNKQSFNDVDYWLEQIKLSSNDDITIYLLGNKKDLENNRVIDEKAGNNKAKAQRMNKFYEVSAKTKENLDKMFREFYMEIYRKNKSKFIEKKNQNLKAFETFQKQENNNNGCC